MSMRALFATTPKIQVRRVYFMSVKFYPWQQSQWQVLQQYLQQQRMPHALLFSGGAGLGKLHFAKLFAQSLLCSERTADFLACNHCQNCLLFAQGNQPDLCLCQPAETGQIIKIDQIRAFSEWATYTRHTGAYKVAILEPAEAMNSAAANSLLKTLEEPPAGLIIILVSHQPLQLPATIRSRCQWLKFVAEASLTLPWLIAQLDETANPERLLEQAFGSPLQAINLAENSLQQQQQKLYTELTTANFNPVALAAANMQMDIQLILNRLIAWTMIMIRLAAGINLPNTNKLQAIVERSEASKLFAYLDKLYGVRRQLLQHANLNQQLLLEDLFCQWAQL